MQATAIGPNRTGAALTPAEVAKMLDAVNEFSAHPISTLQIDIEPSQYITEADAVGSIPPPPRRKGQSVRPITPWRACSWTS